MMMKEYPLFVNDSGAPKDYMEKYMTNVSLFIPLLILVYVLYTWNV